MSIHPEAITTPPCTTIAIDHGRRLLIEPWQNAAGTRFVTVAPQHKDRSGAWRLSHSGLILSPEVARELAPALLTIAAHIDGGPVDPMPTEADREESRMP